VGIHKTGTTSFQAFMLRAAEDFARAGISVRTEVRRRRDGARIRRANSVILSNLVIRRPLMTGARLRGTVRAPEREELPALMRQCRNSLERQEQRDILVSSEGFCFARTQDEAKRLRRLFGPSVFRLVPILVLRNRTDWKASWEAQLDKEFGVAEGMRGLPPPVRIDAPWYYRRDRIVDFWRKAGDLQLIDYDEAMAEDGSIIPALLRAIGVADRIAPLDLTMNKRRAERLHAE
jgi:hypothetical protein